MECRRKLANLEKEKKDDFDENLSVLLKRKQSLENNYGCWLSYN
jgi:hypothetical protein